MSVAPLRLTRAIEALWQGPPLNSTRPHRSDLFSDLINVCVELFPDAVGTVGPKKAPDREGAGWAIANALRATGTPWSPMEEIAALAPPPEAVALTIAKAMSAKEVELTHLCPLDQADEWPVLTFGPCEARRFEPKELTAIFQPARLWRHYRNWHFDFNSLARFPWLIAHETLPLSHPVGSRALPFLYQTLEKPFGAVKPYTRPWPHLLEQAVFLLLLLPWEKMTEHCPFEWRGFRIPWCYTINPDPFSWQSQPPPLEGLSWELDIFTDPVTEETIETYRPEVLPLIASAAGEFHSINDQRWHNVKSTRSSDVLNPLVAHFLVHAFLSVGIDEFLAHMICVEAALGMRRDHDPRRRPKVNGNDMGATARVTRRVYALTGDASKAEDFRRLFKLRSDFVHGNMLGSLSPDDMVTARALARDVADKLVGAAVKNSDMSRERFLESLCR